MDRTLTMRVIALYLPVAAMIALWLRERPTRRASGGTILAFCWNIAILVPLQLVAAHFGWWRFADSPAQQLPFPFELIVGWAIAWGVLPILFRPRPRMTTLLAVALLSDVILMPALHPLVLLGPGWWIGEGVALLVCFLPGVLLGWWMTDDRRLGCRASVQVLTFALLAGVPLPALIVLLTTGERRDISTGPSMLLPQLALLFALPGLSAVQEFVQRGGGRRFPSIRRSGW